MHYQKLSIMYVCMDNPETISCRAIKLQLQSEIRAFPALNKKT